MDLRQVIAIRDETSSDDDLQFVYEDEYDDVPEEVAGELGRAQNGFSLSLSNVTRELFDGESDAVDVALVDNEGRFVMWNSGFRFLVSHQE